MTKLYSLKSNSNRQSNMELLRIVAMFLVLIVHADFAALGHPTYEQVVNETAVTLWRYIFEGLAIVCVNVFVLLSGWFGIRPSIKGFSKFIFQVFFFSLALYLFGWGMDWNELTWKGWIETLTFSSPLYWFIVSYIGLYILSPVLNAYIEKAKASELGWTLVLFYIFQTLYGCLLGDEYTIFKNGYSTLSFVGLYLLAQYVRKFQPKWSQWNKMYDMGIYLVLSILIALIGFFGIYFRIDGLNTQLLAYSDPIVIASSLYLLLFFTKINIQSSVINFISASSFAVFLLHLNPNFYFKAFKEPIQFMDTTYPPLQLLGIITAFLIAIFILSIIVDQIRIILWNAISSFNNKQK